MYRVGKKRARRLMIIILSNLNRLKNLLKSTPHLAYVATLSCETLISAKQATNDELQSTVATY